MRRERKEQPGMEMGKEIRTFHEKGRRGTLRHPFGVGWWTPGYTGWRTSTEVLVENTEQPGDRGWKNWTVRLYCCSQQPPFTGVR